MHILFLTDNFPPEVNAPASRTFEHCKEWVRAGHRVTVITCAPNFPRGQVFPGYRNSLWTRETMEGIGVVRVWTYITANEEFLKRILDYVSYMVSSSVAAPLIKDVDLVVGTSPQFFTACAAYLVSRMKRIPFIFELRDLWPESIRAVGAMDNPLILKFLEHIELFLYAQASAIVTVTHSFKRSLTARGINPNRMHVITNGVDLARYHPRERDRELIKQLGLEGKFVAGYVGTHGMAHGLETLLEAADLLRRRPGGDRYRILMLGDGARKRHLVERSREMGLQNMVFLDSVSKEEVVRYWSLLDVSIIHLKRCDTFSKVIPSKLFECMAMGIPVLHGVKGESAEIVEATGVGLVFEPENAGQLCENLERMGNDPSELEGFRQNGLKAAQEYSRPALAGRMLSILRSIVEARGEMEAFS